MISTSSDAAQNLADLQGAGGPNRLKDDVDIVALGDMGLLLVDRQSGNSYTIGRGEKRLVELLDDGKSVDSIVIEFSASADREVSRRDVVAFIENLRQLGLLQASKQTLNAGQHVSAEQTEAPLNPGHSKRLNSFFDVLAVLFGWVDHWTVAVVIGLAFLTAMNILFRYPWNLLSDIETFRRKCPFWLWLTMVEYPKLLLLDLIYTLVLGTVARKRGANLRKIGMQWWQGMIPIFHLDMGASFALMTRADRRALMLTSLGFPLAVGSFALNGWFIAGRGTSGSIACLLLVPVSYIWFLVQLSPLLKSSTGLLLLCDYTREEDIQAWALDETHAWLFGRPRPRPLTSNERFWFRVYGILYWLTRVAVNVITLVLAKLWAFPKFHVEGAMCVLVILCYWDWDLFAKAYYWIRDRFGRWTTAR